MLQLLFTYLNLSLFTNSITKIINPIESMPDRTINVLYIDDEPHNLTAFKAAFRRDYNIYLAESAEEGRKILDTHDIQIILSDQRMPVMTGIEFFQSIGESQYFEVCRDPLASEFSLQDVFQTLAYSFGPIRSALSKFSERLITFGEPHF